jgi:hypothetical protein
MLQRSNQREQGAHILTVNRMPAYDRGTVHHVGQRIGITRNPINHTLPIAPGFGQNTIELVWITEGLAQLGAPRRGHADGANTVSFQPGCGDLSGAFSISRVDYVNGHPFLLIADALIAAAKKLRDVGIEVHPIGHSSGGEHTLAVHVPGKPLGHLVFHGSREVDGLAPERREAFVVTQVLGFSYAEAAEVCEAVGKRLCDAHEWEGACEGRLDAPDYRFDLARTPDPSEAIRRMRAAHNQTYGGRKTWSYGSTYRSGICGTSSQKSPDCAGDGWKT